MDSACVNPLGHPLVKPNISCPSENPVLCKTQLPVTPQEFALHRVNEAAFMATMADVNCQPTLDELSFVRSFTSMAAKGQIYVTLSRSSSTCKPVHSCSNTTWSRSSMQTKPHLVHVTDDFAVPYLIRAHFVSGYTLATPTVPSQPIIVPGPLVLMCHTWPQIRRVLSNFGCLSTPLHFSVTDACHLAVGGAFPIFERVAPALHIHAGYSVAANPGGQINKKFTSMASTIAQMLPLLPPEASTAAIDKLSAQLLQLQVELSHHLYPPSSVSDVLPYHGLTSNAVSPLTLGVASFAAGALVATVAAKAYYNVSETLVQRMVFSAIPYVRQMVAQFCATVAQTLAPSAIIMTIGYILYITLLRTTDGTSTTTALVVSVMTALLVVVFKSTISEAFAKVGIFLTQATNIDSGILPYHAEGSMTPLTVGRILIAVITLATGIVPTGQMSARIMTGFRSASYVSSTLMRFENILEYGLKIIPGVLTEIYYGRDPRVAFYSSVVPADHFSAMQDVFDKWVTDSAALQPEAVLIELASSPKLRADFIDLMEQGESLKENGLKYSRCASDPRFKQFIQQHKALLGPYRDAKLLHGSPTTVLTPFCFYLAGQPGVGKTSVLRLFAQNIFGDQTRIYSRDSTDSYWSGYNPSYNTLMFDDFNQIRSAAAASDDCSDLFKVKTSSPARLPMAGMSEDIAIGVKGTIYGSPLILIASNTEVPSSPNISKQTALLRRRDVCMRLTAAPSYLNEHSQIDWERANAIPGEDCVYQKILTFNEYDPLSVSGPYNGKPRSFDQAIAYVRAKFIEHIRGEISRVNVSIDLSPPIPDFSTHELAPILPDLPYHGRDDPVPSTSEAPDVEQIRIARSFYSKDGNLPDRVRRIYAIPEPTMERNADIFATMSTTFDDLSGEQRLECINSIRAASVSNTPLFVIPERAQLRSRYDEMSSFELANLVYTAVQAGFVHPFTLEVLVPCKCEDEPGMHVITPACFPDIIDMMIDSNISTSVLFKKNSWLNRFGRIVGGSWITEWIARNLMAAAAPDVQTQRTQQNILLRRVIISLGSALAIGCAGIAMGRLVARSVQAIKNIFSTCDINPLNYCGVMQGSGGSGDITAAYERGPKPGTGRPVALRYNGSIVNVAEIVHSNLVSVEVTHNAQVTRGTAFFLAGRTLLIPAHFFHWWEDVDTVSITLSAYGLFNHAEDHERQWQSYTFDFLTRPYAKLGGESRTQDLIAVVCPPAIRLYRNLIPHICSTHDHRASFPAQQVGFAPREAHIISEVQYFASTSPDKIFGDPEVPNSTITMQDIITFPFPGTTGMCGSPILSNYSGTRNTLNGIYISGRGSWGFGFRLFQEDMQTLVDALDDFRDPPLVPGSLGPRGYTRLVGDFVQYGYTARQDHQSLTRLAPSILAAAAGAATVREPAIIARNDARWIRFLKTTGRNNPVRAPLNHAVMKYAKVFNVPMDASILSRARRAYLYRNGDAFVTTDARIYSIEDVLQGIGSLKPLDLTTSAGLPYCEQGVTRKRLVQVFDYGVRQLLPSFAVEVQELEDRFGDGDLSLVVWKDFAKDELRTKDKIRMGKTRHITMPPLSFNIITKRYFGAFEAAFKVTGFQGGSAVGIACESKQWDTLVRHLQNAAGEDGAWWSGDYTNFDGSIPAEVIGEFLIMVEDFYNSECAPALPHNERKRNARIRACIIEHIIHSIAKCDDLVYQKHLGNPSGCPITTMLNTVCNLLMVNYGLISTGIALTGDDLQRVAMVAYGDDLQLSVPADLYGRGCTLQAVAEQLKPYGVTLNSEHYVQRGWQPGNIRQQVFLKRTTVYSEEHQHYIPRLASRSIDDILNWTRCKNEYEQIDIVEGHVLAAQIFIWFYGKQSFDQMTQRIEKLAHIHWPSHGFKLFTYEQLCDMYHSDTIDSWFVAKYEDGCDAGSLAEFLHPILPYHGNTSSITNNNNFNGDHNSADGNTDSSKATTKVDISPDIDVPVSAMPAGLDNNTIANALHQGERAFSGHNASVDKAVAAQMMSLQADNFGPVTTEMLGVAKDEMNLSTMAPRFHRAEIVKWNTGQMTNTLLATRYLTPYGTQSSNRANMSPLEYCLKYATFWKGDLIFRAEIVATEFHSGKLFFGVHYGAYDHDQIKNMSIAEKTGQYGAYIDARNGVFEFEFRVKYVASTPWLNAYSSFTDPVDWSMGSVALSVVNNLTAMASIGQEVDINIYVVGAENFMMHYPANQGNTIPSIGLPWHPLVPPVVPVVQDTYSFVHNVSIEHTISGAVGFSTSNGVAAIPSTIQLIASGPRTYTIEVDVEEQPVGCLGWNVLVVFQAAVEASITVSALLNATSVQSVLDTRTLPSNNGTVHFTLGATAFTAGTDGIATKFELIVNTTQDFPSLSLSGFSFAAYASLTSVDNARRSIGSVATQVGTDQRSFSTIFDNKPAPGVSPFIVDTDIAVAFSDTATLVSMSGLSTSARMAIYSTTVARAIPPQLYPGATVSTGFGPDNLQTVIEKSIFTGTAATYWLNTMFVEGDVIGDSASITTNGYVAAGDGVVTGLVQLREATQNDHLEILPYHAETVPETAPVMSHENESIVVSTIAAPPEREDSHFMENISDLRLPLRRFNEVQLLTFPASPNDTTQYIPLIDLMRSHPAFAHFAPLYRYMRGRVRLRVILTSDSGTLKMRVHPDSYNPLYVNADPVASGLAIAYVNPYIPVTTFVVPYLSTLHCVYTPWSVPPGGSSFSPSVSFTFYGTQVATVRVLLSFDDAFRLGTFVGVPRVFTTEGPPNWYLPAAAPPNNAVVKQNKIPLHSSFKSKIPTFALADSGQTGIELANLALHKLHNVNGRVNQLQEEVAKLEHCDEPLPYHGDSAPVTDPMSDKGVLIEESRAVLPSVHTIKANDNLARRHMKELDWKVADLVVRPMYVGTYSWSTSDVIGTKLATINLPLDILKNDISKVPFDNFRFVRWKSIELRFQVNGTSMHAGRLIAWCAPGVTEEQQNNNYDNVDFATSLDAHTILNPAKSTVATIAIPFTHPLGFLHMGELVDDKQFFTKFMGNVFLAVFNPLIASTGATQTVSVNVIASIKLLHAKVPQTRSQ